MARLGHGAHAAVSPELLVVEAGLGVSGYAVQSSVNPPVGTPPEDATHWRCHCGHRFMAAATTTVTCPRCGDRQVR